MAVGFAEKYGLDSGIFKAQMHHESGWNTRIRSRAGAIGVAQIMPGTARKWRVDPLDPKAALDAAARNMARYQKTYERQGHDYQTSHKMALAAYNAGPGAVAKYKGVPRYRETQNYVRIIMPHMSKVKTASVPVPGGE